MSLAFWSLAAAMVVAGTAAVVWPMARAGSPMWSRLGVAVFVPALVVVVYAALGEPDALDPQTARSGGAPDMQTMVSRLEDRLEERPDDAEAWAMYGRALVSQGQYAEAARAWARRRELPGGDDADVLANLAEARILAAGGPISRPDRALVEEALARAPQHPKALWYGGVAARQAGERELAVERWRSLLAMGPPESLAQVLREQIQEAGGDAADPVMGSGAAAGPGIVVEVALADGRELPEMEAAAALFVFVRSASGGPPLAVRRLPPDLPVSIELGPEDAMMGGRGLSEGQDVTVVARLSMDGDVQADPEDLEGSAAAVVGAGTPAQIVLEGGTGR